MRILGISAYFHDSAAAIIQDGKLIAAAEEERFNREKHTRDLPIGSTAYCLKQINATIDDIDIVAFYQKPFLTVRKRMEFILKTLPQQLPTLFSSRFTAESGFTLKSIQIATDLYRQLGGKKNKFPFQFEMHEHHLTHAASAFYPSQFKEAAILSIDGAGEFTTTLLAYGNQNGIKKIHEIEYPHSVGLLYSTATQFLGFTPFHDEGKVMGLAPYGKNRFKNFFDDMIFETKNGFEINTQWFDYWKGSYQLFSDKWINAFGKQREKHEEISKRDQDVAQSLQKKTEALGVAVAKKLKKLTRSENICIAGGVGLNALMNTQILKKAGFKNIFVQPAANDAGGALGAAMLSHAKHTSMQQSTINFPSTIYLGPKFSNTYIHSVLKKYNDQIAFEKIDSIVEKTAIALTHGKVIGWFGGRMEFGPRALGARSIIADPRDPTMRDRINLKIKQREAFRPFAPSILEEKLSDWFEINHPSPFMNLVYEVKPEKRKLIPAPTHVDGTGRVQTVTKKKNGRWYDLIKKFDELTDVPILLNTSFNGKNQPIVCTPHEALEAFIEMTLDVLVLEDYWVEKR